MNTCRIAKAANEGIRTQALSNLELFSQTFLPFSDTRTKGYSAWNKVSLGRNFKHDVFVPREEPSTEPGTATPSARTT